MMALLQPANLRQMAVTIVRSLIRASTPVTDADQVDTLFRRDQPSQTLAASFTIHHEPSFTEFNDMASGGSCGEVNHK
jgi:hypothetical protein